MNFKLINVDHWKADIYEYGAGEREKEWLTSPETGEIVMFKLPRENRGEHWAEKLCSEIAKIIDFPCAKVELATRNGKVGCLSYFIVNVEKGYSHYDGGKFFPEEYDFNKNKGYNVQLIKEVLSKHSLFEDFLYIIVFDALVGEGDRHQDNWGITRHETEDYQIISPLYDNSASLTRELDESKVDEYLRDREKFLIYINRSKSKMGWEDKRQVKHFQLIKLILGKYPEKVHSYLQRLRKLTDKKINEIVMALPSEVISYKHKLLVINYIIERREILLRIGDNMQNEVKSLLLIWKDPDSRRQYIVGRLSKNNGTYMFKYVNPELEEARNAGFKYYPGFENLTTNYEASKLFQGFQRRLPRPGRPDYNVILERYGLTQVSSELEILEATGGRLPTDTFSFVNDFNYIKGKSNKLTFNIAGARHYELPTIKDSITVGDTLILELEPDNDYDQYAIKVLTLDKKLLGYVPRYYSKEVSRLVMDAKYSAKVVSIYFESNLPDDWVKVRIEVK